MNYNIHILSILTLSFFASCAKDSSKSETKNSDESKATVVVERYDEGTSMKVDSDFQQPEGKYSIQIEGDASNNLFGASLTSQTFVFSGNTATSDGRLFKVRFIKQSDIKAVMTIYDDSGKTYFTGKVIGNKKAFSLFVLRKDQLDSAGRSYDIIKFTAL